MRLREERKDIHWSAILIVSLILSISFLGYFTTRYFLMERYTTSGEYVVSIFNSNTGNKFFQERDIRPVHAYRAKGVLRSEVKGEYVCINIGDKTVYVKESFVKIEKIGE